MNLSATNRFNQVAWLLVFTYIAGMFLPRLVGEGMFADGLCYAAIARNMADGHGTLWTPFFSSSFWLPYNTGPIFYENLPLTFWLQSWFFRLFGDAWWVEKLYCAVVLVAVAALIVAVWRKACAVFNPEWKPLGWLPVLFWYTVPTVIWASPNNQLDYTMSFFSLAAVYFVMPSARPQWWHFALGGLLVFVAFLCKSPVGIFPLAVPLVAWLVFRHETFAEAFLANAIVVVSFVIFMVALWLHEPARDWLNQYVNQQLLSALAGKRETTGGGWQAHVYILPKIFTENAPALAFGLAFTLLVKRRKSLRIKQNGLFWFFLLIGVSGSLPIIISPKQDQLYLLPAFPFFALAIAFLFAPAVSAWSNLVAYRSVLKKWSVGLWVILAGVLVYSYWLWGTPNREQDVLADMNQAAKIIPTGAKVGVCPSMMPDFVHHCYFQRYHKWELTTDPTQTSYFLIQDDCQPAFEDQLKAAGFQYKNEVMERYRIFVKAK